MRNSLYILSQFDDEDIRWLAGAGAVQELDSGMALINAGSTLHSLFIVTDGMLRVNLPDGTTVAERGVGDVLGEMSLLERRPPATNVVARGPVTVLAIPLETLHLHLDRKPEFAARFYKAVALFLSDRLRDTHARPDATGQLPPKELDELLLDNMHVAGERLHRLLDMLGRARVVNAPPASAPRT